MANKVRLGSRCRVGRVVHTVYVTEKFPFRSRFPKNGDKDGNKTALKNETDEVTVSKRC